MACFSSWGIEATADAGDILIADAPNQNEAKRLITFLTGASARASYAAQAFEPMP